MTLPVTNTYAMQIAATMTPTQQGIFYGEYTHRAKNYNTALIWAILTGWPIGGHNFYLGRIGRGILHIVLAIASVSIVGLLLTIYDIINLHKTVDQINMGIANEIAARVRAMVPSE
ncbi:MAG: TM2 domain-containing protein [Ktedonobacterales bacterium]|nr:TM2 domain-containing protein [Ktedonobacterales bacterium]